MRKILTLIFILFSITSTASIYKKSWEGDVRYYGYFFAKKPNNSPLFKVKEYEDKVFTDILEDIHFSMFGRFYHFAPTTYYISNSGNYYNDGLSPVTPWTVGKLIDVINTSVDDGSDILFKSGERFYINGLVISNSNGLTFDSYGTGDRPILDGSINISGSWTNEGNNIWSKTNSSFPDLDTRMKVPIGTFIDGDWEIISKAPTTQLLGVVSSTTSNSVTDNSASWTTNEFAGSYYWVNHHPWYYSMTKIISNDANTLYLDVTDGNYGKGELGQNGCAYLISNCSRGLNSNGKFMLKNDKLSIYYNGDLNTKNVEFVNADNIITFNTASNLTIQNISFTRANMECLEVNDGSNVLVQNCNFSYAGNLAAQFERMNTVTFNNCFIQHTQTSGVFFRDATKVIAKYNIFKHIAVNLGVENEDSGFPGFCITLASDPTPDNFTNDLSYNIMDTVFGGINWYWNQDNMLIQRNYINSYGWNHGDYAAIYGSAVEYNVQNLAKNNIILNAAPAQLIWRGSSEDLYAQGMYVDGGNKNITFDSITLSNGNMALKINDGNTNIKLRYSIISNMCRDMNHDDNWQSMTISNTSSTVDNEYRYNTYILGPTSISGTNQRFNMYHDTQMDRVTSNNNKFVAPFTNNTSNYFRRIVNYYTSFQDYTLEQIRSSHNLELNSTLNPQGVTYSGSLGITESNFVNLFVNVSNNTKTFSLGDCIFRNINGSLVSGTVSVKPYYSEPLFYVSGNLNTTDNKVYIENYNYVPDDNGNGGGNIQTGLPVGQSVLLFGNKAKYLKFSENNKKVYNFRKILASRVYPTDTSSVDPPTPVDTADFNIFYSNDFSQWPVGYYTQEQHYTDGDYGLYEWGLGARNPDIVDPYSGFIALDNGDKALKIEHKANKFGAGSGASFEHYISSPQQEAYFSTNFKLSPGFPAGWGGKFPGLMGGLVVIPYASMEGFNASPMWNENLALHCYIYHAAQSGEYGEGGDWLLNGGSVMSPNTWHNMTIRVVMNTIGQANGIFEAWLDNVLVYQSDHYEFRTTSNVAIERILFVNFRGGSTIDWAVSTDSYVLWDDWVVFNYKDNVSTTRGLNLSPTNRTLALPIQLKN